MNLKTLATELDARRRIVDSAIDQTVGNYPWAVDELREAVRYALEGGKRLRGVILLSVYEELSKESPPSDLSGALSFAVGIEMIHAYSLVHDDLPCMDDDDYRRGRLSCHKKFGEAIALLCGDALFTMAFECMLSCKDIPRERVLRAALEIARAAGPSGMVGGQVLDLLLEGRTDVERMPDMYRMKTGALFRCSAMAGAILAGAPAGAVELCGQWGEQFGYAYQILDDIEDAGSSGKEKDKNTLLKVLTLPEVRLKAKQLLEGSIEAASHVFPGEALIKQLSAMYLLRLKTLEQSG